MFQPPLKRISGFLVKISHQSKGAFIYENFQLILDI